jgi:hypothetical protein
MKNHGEIVGDGSEVELKPVASQPPTSDVTKSAGTAEPAIHSCHICSKKFSKRYVMNVHVKEVHLGMRQSGNRPKKYVCTVCEKAFDRSNTLERHMVIHTGQKPHTCHDCGKKFARICDLQRHIWMHTGEKPYACSHCDMKFRIPGNRNQHVEAKHKNLWFVCKECNKTFRAFYMYKKHMKQSHQVIISKHEKETAGVPTKPKEAEQNVLVSETGTSAGETDKTSVMQPKSMFDNFSLPLQETTPTQLADDKKEFASASRPEPTEDEAAGQLLLLRSQLSKKNILVKFPVGEDGNTKTVIVTIPDFPGETYYVPLSVESGDYILECKDGDFNLLNA